MSQIIEEVDSTILAKAVIEGIQNKKGKKIYLLDLREVNSSMCDYFIICSGDSDTQVNAISDSIVDTVRELTNDKPWHVEGKTVGEWVLIDYVSVVGHVFKKETREFFDLEGLWADAKITVIEED